MRVLETARLTLRWLDDGDAAFIVELLNDPAWLANIGDRGVRTLDDARAFIAEKIVASYWHKGCGLWAMQRRSDGALVGICGLLERDSLPDVDVGYALLPRFRGHGWAREAAAACVDYARATLGRPRVLAIVQPENAASIRVLESLGLQRRGSHRLDGEAQELALFASGDAAPLSEVDRDEAIDALVRRFYAAFANREAPAHIAALPSLFLLDGRLLDFAEHETAGETVRHGALAWHASRYAKAGKLDGQPYAGSGRKHFALVATPRGWKIAALSWQEDVA
jgi:RimJ/RimL family protein N-acetyltransferase